MKADGDILIVLAVQFAVMALLALGGANAVVPEMHRQAEAAGCSPCMAAWKQRHLLPNRSAQRRAALSP